MKNFDVRGCARAYLAVSWVLWCILLRAHKAYILCNNRSWMLFLKVDCEILFSSPIAAGAKCGKAFRVTKERVFFSFIIESWRLFFLEAAKEYSVNKVHF